jgi:hypothetical protein
MTEGAESCTMAASGGRGGARGYKADRELPRPRVDANEWRVP